MPHKEKARQKGEPIPNSVCQDNSEIKLQPLDLQALRLNRRFGFAFDTAVVIASLAWGIAR
jgi:hypothetical protein